MEKRLESRIRVMVYPTLAALRVEGQVEEGQRRGSAAGRTRGRLPHLDQEKGGMS